MTSNTETFAQEIAQFIQINNIDLTQHSMNEIVVNYMEATRRTEEQAIEWLTKELAV